MPYVVVEDFRAGLDARRSIISGPPGSLHDLINAHITRGGDIEKRKAFVPLYNLPAGTFGAQAAKGSIYVFGSGAAPGGIPAGVIYQRLQHPDGFAMTSIVQTKVLEGKVFALAKFSDGSVLPFNDGAVVSEWLNGIARASMVNVAGIATHLASIINAHADYNAVAAGNEITVTSAKNTGFSVEVSATNKDGGVDNQTITFTTTQEAVEDVAEIKATATFRIVGGSASAGGNQVTSVKINAVEQLNAAVNWAGSNELTAQAVAASINANTAANPNFTAKAEGDVVTLIAPSGSGATYNGANVLVTTAGNVVVCAGGFTVTDGTNNPGVNTIASVKVNGVTITSGALNYQTDNATTAAAVAANINAFASTPNYQAFANGPTVYLTDTTAEPDDPKNFTVAVTVAGNVTVTATSVSSTVTAPAGGRLATTGQPQITKITLGGTFEAGDRFRIKLGDSIFGHDRVGLQTPATVLPLKEKIHIGAGSILFFAGVGTPAEWNSDATGAGLINISNDAGGFEDLVGLGIYRNNIAVFTRDATQIWFVDADPLRNSQVQVMPNIGAIATNSIVTFGDNDIFFLSDTGIRSLRVRDTTENLSVYDVGTPIDDYIARELADATDAVKAAAVGAIEPTDGRYWLAVNGLVYVFSYFPTSKISAWSVYDPGFTISDLTKMKGRVYARSGNTIYVYGGTDGKTYDSCRVEAELPYLDANQPATHKTYQGMDVVLEGTWTVYAGTDPVIPDARERIMDVSQPTLNQRQVPFVGYGTHVGLKFVSEAPGAAKISKAIVHFQTGESD